MKHSSVLDSDMKNCQSCSGRASGWSRMLCHCVGQVPTSSGSDQTIDLGAKTIEKGAKTIEKVAKTIEMGAATIEVCIETECVSTQS